MEAGLLPGDELLAIGGRRTAGPDDADRLFESLREGEAVPAIFARAGLVQTRSLVPRRDPHVSVSLRITGESALRAAWLRRDE